MGVSDSPTLQIDWSALQACAAAAKQHAHAPYSRFHVGAALLASDDRIFAGANVENASYGLTVCAERVALAAAITAGAREFVALAIVADAAASPCGACRQVLAEFAATLPLRCYVGKVEFLHTDVAALLPHAFTL